MGSIASFSTSTALNGSIQSAIASIIVPQNGKLVGIRAGIIADLKTDGAYVRAQIGFGPSGFPSSNPVWTVLLEIAAMTGFVTSGLTQIAVNEFQPLPDLDVFQGQYIYLHQYGTNAITPTIWAQCMFNFKQAIVMG